MPCWIINSSIDSVTVTVSLRPRSTAVYTPSMIAQVAAKRRHEVLLEQSMAREQARGDSEDEGSSEDTNEGGSESSPISPICGNGSQIGNRRVSLLIAWYDKPIVCRD